MRRKPKYTIEEIRQRVTPVARRYGFERVSLFGSYARNEARAKSDVDLLVHDPKKKISGFLDWAGLYNDFEDALEVKIDLVTTADTMSEKFKNRILKDEVVIYAEERA